MYFAAPVWAQGIENSVHDLRPEPWNTNGDLCAVCHTPHNADDIVSDAPLWDHTVTSATFTAYNSTTMETNPGQPAGISKLCLSCHDGQTALDSYGTMSGSNTMDANSPASFGLDLRQQHPIRFTYDTSMANADGELHNPSNTPTNLGGNIDGTMLFGSGADQLECGSCHDVHNNIALPNLLRITTADGDLCLTCHDK